MHGRRLTILLALCAAAACATACGGGGQNSGPALSATPEQRPELTYDIVRKAIVGAWVEDVPAADGKGKPENWGFDYNEPREVEIVDQKVEGDRATVVVNMKTRSHPRARNQKSLEGQLRLHLELRTELIFREWDVTEIENISFKYTTLQPSPSPQESPGVSPNPLPQNPPEGAPPPPPPPPQG
ncbi:MAG: hypothetical protein LC800_20860 [Acidobacteria bacterium]|nr:hypothetical protein [Acidobacteriota bacterium]